MLRAVRFLQFTFVLLSACTAAKAQERNDGEKRDFFEKRIRPVLVAACYECHNSSGKKEGGLALDHRQGLLVGGDRGAAIEPGNAAKSLLIASIRHAEDDLRMPRGGAKLKPAVIEDFVRWINEGAFDPREAPPSAAELAKAVSWEETRARRTQWWSFRPLRDSEPPGNRTEQRTIDRFIEAKLSEQKLTASPPADRAALMRRASLLLTGLPPTAAELNEFLADDSSQAYERLVDRLLASPRFGERWARHFMDWFRYAESHGSEGDPAIPHAYRYRDYLIRALNHDIPYDRLVLEHLAGDLLPDPRIDFATSIHESALGIGHLRMVQHGYAPTDALDEHVRFIDNQIDTVTKAFLGLTVSCARCHNHKFDPIGQDDYYALFGVFASCRPGLITIDTPQTAAIERLTQLKSQLRERLAETWMKQEDRIAAKLRSLGDDSPIAAEVKREGAKHPLHAWFQTRAFGEDAARATLKRLQAEYAEAAEKERAFEASLTPIELKIVGVGDANGRSKPHSDFALALTGTNFVERIVPIGFYSSPASLKQAAVLESPRFRNEFAEVFVRAAGGGNARARYVVWNYPRSTLLYPQLKLAGDAPRWQRFDTSYWLDDMLHLELATGDDTALEPASEGGRSWFSALRAGARPKNAGPPPFEAGAPLFAIAAIEPDAPADMYLDAILSCVKQWQAGTLNEASSEFLQAALRAELLPNRSDELAELTSLLEEYRRNEAELRIPVRAPGVHEGDAFNQPLLSRGDHKKPLAEVPRRFLSAIDDSELHPASGASGRLELARRFVDQRNPLLARVIVNRIWHHLFGRGLVATPDNFGALGEEPSHAELLDHLALRFSGGSREQANLKPWSIKGLIREIAMTEAFRRSSIPIDEARENDPQNVYLSHFSARRLEAEAIRDSLLFVSGELDETRFGPSVPGSTPRRGVYVQVRRNALDPFLAAFDTPEPADTRGRREVSNIPAQSLTLMNDPLVSRWAERWADRMLADQKLDFDQRIRTMLIAALGRMPSSQEIERARSFFTAADHEQSLVAAKTTELQRAVADHRAAIESLTGEVRKKLTSARNANGKSEEAWKALHPTARWTFDSDLRDSVGSLHGTLMEQGRAVNDPSEAIAAGGVTVSDSQYVVTEKTSREFRSKTLEVWMRLTDLEQRSGGAMSLESLGGERFDAIVFAEQEPRKWMAGSNFFQRTQSLVGETETEASERTIHVAIAYAADGTISAYRNGAPYGKPYRKGETLPFAAEQSHVLFGLRHSPSGANRHLKGRIEEARLYDRALTAEEAKASFESFGAAVSESEVAAALDPAARKQWERIAGEIMKLENELRALGAPDERASRELRSWREFAHALFNLKEFSYVR